MKKDKLYLIISILFVTILVVLYNGFNKTYSAEVNNLYWAVDGTGCDYNNGGCTLKISNNSISGIHYGYGTFDGNEVLSSSPWNTYYRGISNILIGGENDIIMPKSTAYWFYGLLFVSNIDFTYLDTSQVTNMSHMFYETGSAVHDFEIDVSNFDTSSVISMQGMFLCCGQASHHAGSMVSDAVWSIGDLSSWNVSKVEDMSYMFGSSGSGATIWDIGDIGEWNVSNVTNMSHMFYNFDSMSKVWNIGDISNWNVSNVIDMSYMFDSVGYFATDFDIGDLSGWDVSQVINMEYMFSYVGYNSKYVKLNLDNWNTSNVTNMSHMFSYMGQNSEYVKLNLDNWNTSNVTDMEYMFYMSGCYSESFDIEGLDNWNTSQVTNMKYMFDSAGSNASSWSIGDISSWNVSNVKNMSFMFNDAGSISTNWNIGSLDNWVTSSVEDMSYMFASAGSNTSSCSIGDISGWDVSNVTNMTSMFYDSYIEYLNLSGWDTSNIVEYDNAFDGYISKITVGDKFNLNISDYLLRNVETNVEYNNGEIPSNVAATYEIIYPIVYWQVIDNTLEIIGKKNNNEEVFNIFNTESDNLPWYEYKENINKIIIGSEDDVIRPYQMNFWFSDMVNVKELDLSNVDSIYLTNISEMFSNMTSLEKLNMGNLDFSKIDYCYYSRSINPNVNTNVRNSEIENSGCDIFYENNNLREITVGENNIIIVKESLENPNSEYIIGTTGKWYDIDGNSYDVSELLEDKNNTYYAFVPHKVSYNVDGIDYQVKSIGEDLILYDEIIKDSEITEIVTKFDTDDGNIIDDITSLKITTYTLKDFNDSDGNIYLPGSKYTKDEDLELNVNYNSEDHYNEIELPIPVKKGYKFEYWTLDGEKIDEYTPKTNETLVAVWTEIKYNFIDGTDNVNYEEESEDKVIFVTDGIIENFKNLYVNGKRFELGEDYTLDKNMIVLTEKGKAYLDSLEPGEYEVKAEFSDSNSDVYGIIKVSEKEVVPEEEPKEETKDNPIEEHENDEPKDNFDDEAKGKSQDNSKEESEEQSIDNSTIPKTADYILFTVIIALTALISSIFVYKKIEY